jgi:hypothetical protein
VPRQVRALPPRGVVFIVQAAIAALPAVVRAEQTCEPGTPSAATQKCDCPPAFHEQTDPRNGGSRCAPDDDAATRPESASRDDTRRVGGGPGTTEREHGSTAPATRWVPGLGLTTDADADGKDSRASAPLTPAELPLVVPPKLGTYTFELGLAYRRASGISFGGFDLGTQLHFQDFGSPWSLLISGRFQILGRLDGDHPDALVIDVPIRAQANFNWHAHRLLSAALGYGLRPEYSRVSFTTGDDNHPLVTNHWWIAHGPAIQLRSHRDSSSSVWAELTFRLERASDVSGPYAYWSTEMETRVFIMNLMFVRAAYEHCTGGDTFLPFSHQLSLGGGVNFNY